MLNILLELSRNIKTDECFSGQPHNHEHMDSGNRNQWACKGGHEFGKRCTEVK